MVIRRWYNLEGDECATVLRELCHSLREEQESRRLRYLESVCRYESQSIGDTHASAMSKAQSRDELYNITRSVIDTVQADIAARQRPKPNFLTSAADWKTRRRAKKLDRFVEAQLFEDQGSYEDSWQVLLDVFIDACMSGFGTGFAKVSADNELERIRVERVLPYEILVDAEEAKYRDPQNLFHTYTVARDILLETYCGGVSEEEASEGETDEQKSERIDRRLERERADAVMESAIKSAGEDDHSAASVGSLRVADMVRVYEAWRLPRGDRPGRHVICIENKVLFDEEWTRKRFPFVIMQWARERIGFWGHGLADEILSIHISLNEQADRLAERMKKCANARVYVPVGTKCNRQELESNEDMQVIVFQGSQPPIDVPAVPASSQEFEYIAQLQQRGYDYTGVSQMSASSRKDQGVTAAVAMRQLNDIQAVRFLTKARMYEQSFVTLGELVVAAVKDIDGGITARWPGKSFLREIDWSDVELDEELYRVRVAAGSLLSRDVGTRYQMAQEMFEAGQVSAEQFKSLLQMPDLDTVLDRDTAELDYVEMILDRYLDSENATELREAGGYEMPDPAIGDKASALNLVRQTLFEAKRDGAPKYALMLIRRYMDELVAAMAPKEPPLGALPAAAGAIPSPVGAPDPGLALPGPGPAGGAPMPIPGPPPGMPIQ